MNKGSEVPRLVNFSDSDVSTCSDSEEGKEWPSESLDTMGCDKNKYPIELEDTKRVEDSKYSGKPSESKYTEKLGVSKQSERKGVIGETKYGEKSGVGDRIRELKYGERSSETKYLEGSVKRSRSRSRRSGSRERVSKRSKSKSKRSISRDRYKRSRSGSRGRHRSGSKGRRRRSHSGSRRRKEKRHGSPRRSRRVSPPLNRVHRTFETLDKAGVEVKPPTVEEPQPSLPSYYNRMAVNPTKYAQQMAKRKLIWGGKATEESTTKVSAWQGATFSQDQDGKMTAKFKRLMGIKGEEGQQSGEGVQGQELIKRQQELFSSMEIQYEAARQATHTQRGVGLGFSSHPHHFP